MYTLNPVFKKPEKFSHSFNKNVNVMALEEELYTHDPDEDQLSWAWYNPSQTSVPVAFCLDTSLHGLKHVGIQKRHFGERIFWLVAFMASVVIAAILIVGMWNDYTKSPIVTLFNPEQKNLDAIPFPAVTVCNVNNVQRSKVEDLSGIMREYSRQKIKFSESLEVQQALATFLDINYICDNTFTFVDRILQNSTVKQLLRFLRESTFADMKLIKKYANPRSTLRKVSQPCNKMILHCIWLGQKQNCSELFHSIQTDYGYCCTFNMMPVNLLLKYRHNPRNVTAAEEEYIKGWENANLTYENLMFTEETKERKYPRRQRYPGRSAGLSFLVDPALDQYTCSNTDSEGFIMGVNVPLDFPRMKDNGFALQTNSEIFVGVRPEITITDNSIKSFPVENRRCYYENEYQLPHYTEYTVSNCMNECIARKTLDFCNCTLYYMAREEETNLCQPLEYNCTDEAQKWIIKNGLSSTCTECLPTCTEIDYYKQVTTLNLQRSRVDELFKSFPGDGFFYPEHVSIVHVYFESDSIHPRLRKELTSKTQLLSNAGGLLGLCMGFSVLSLLEIFYYGTIRFCCKFYRNKAIREHRSTMVNMENGHSHGEGEAVNPKQSWFSRICNGALGTRNINNHRNMDNNGGSDAEHDHAAFKIHPRPNKLPNYFQGTFGQQFQTAYVTPYSEKRLAYPH